MRTVRVVLMALVGALAVSCGDPSGPDPVKICDQVGATNRGGPEPCVFPNPTLNVTVPSSSMSGIGFSIRVSVSATVSNGTPTSIQWKADGVMTQLTGAQVELDLGSGTHTLCAIATFTGIPSVEVCKVVTVNLTVPTLIMSTADTTVFQTRHPTSPSTFRAEYNGDVADLRWTFKGINVATATKSPTIEMSASSGQLCVENQAAKFCRNVTVTRSGFLFNAYIARAGGAERPLPLGIQVCYYIPSAPRECSTVPTAGQWNVRPSFMDQIQVFRLEISGGGIIPFVVEITLDKFFTTTGGVLIDKNWNGVNLSLTAAYEVSSKPVGWDSFLRRSFLSNGSVSYNLTVFPIESEIPVIFAGASFVDGNTDWSLIGNGQYSNFTDAEIADNLQAMQYVNRELEKIVKFVQVSGDKWNSCNAVVVRKSTSSFSGGFGTSCGSDKTYTGGVVVIGQDYYPDVMYVLSHELGHVLGFGHTCSWLTIMDTCLQPGVQSDRFTSTDKAVVHVFYKVVALQRQFGVAYGLPESHQGERLAACPTCSIEKYTVSRPSTSLPILEH